MRNALLHRSKIWPLTVGVIVLLAGLACSLITGQGSGDTSVQPTMTTLPSAMLSPQPAATQLSATDSPPTAAAETDLPITPTEQPTNTQIPDPSTPTPVYTDLDVNTETSTSPDGMWIAELIEAYPTGGQVPDYYQSLTVRRLDGSVTWTLVDSWSLWALGATSPSIIGWSSGVFYFADHGTADGCDMFGADLNIRRLTLDDGVLSETPILAGSGVSLSPNAPSAAYVSRDRSMPEIVIHDLVTDELRSAALEVGDGYWGAGNVVWSPDGNALMLTIDHSGCGPPENTARSIVRVDVASLAQQTLIDHGDRLFRTDSWPEKDRVLLTELDGGTWWMDAATGEIIGPGPG
jgi:hypothetical protein